MKKIYTVNINFQGSYKKEDFEGEHCQIIQEFGNNLTLKIKGDINELLETS